MTERRLKFSQIFSLVFVGLIFAFTIMSFLPGDDGLLTDSVTHSSAPMQAQSISVAQASQ